MINHFKSINKVARRSIRVIILTDVTSHTYFEKKINNTCKNLKNYENTNINIFKT